MNAPADVVTRTALDSYRDALVVGPAVKYLPKPEPLIDGWLDRNSLAVLYGPSGSGKTFVALDWALCVATKKWWQGHYVEPGRGLYVIAEGIGGFGLRIEAWEHHHLSVIENNVFWLPVAPNLFRPALGAQRALIDLAVELEPDFITIDTLARCTVGGDENSAKDMGIVVEHADALRRATGATVLIVHHSGKDTTAGLRGSSALLGACDTVIRCEGAEGRVTLTVEKQKNHASEARAYLRAIPVLDSIVLVSAAQVDEGDELNATATRVLEVLGEIAVDDGVSSSVWLTACDVPERSFYRSRGRLSQLGRIENVGTEQRPRYRVVTATANSLPNDCHGSTVETLPVTATPLRGGSVAVTALADHDPARARCVEWPND
jgi:AAA domain